MNSILKHIIFFTISFFLIVGCNQDKSNSTVSNTDNFEPEKPIDTTWFKTLSPEESVSDPLNEPDNGYNQDETNSKASETVTFKSEKPIGPTWFKTLTVEESGLDFVNVLDNSDRYNVIDYFNAYNGGGVALGDLDNDGLPDIILSSNLSGIKIYKNKGGLKFENITTTTGIEPMEGWTTGICLVDVNGDKNLDIYVCRAGWDEMIRHNLLYINNGDLTFTEMGREYGLDDNSPTGHATFFDADNDGDLDVYILNHYDDFNSIYITEYYRNINSYNNDHTDKFLRNDGNKFIDVSEEACIVTSFSFGLSVLSFDINEDGWRDIYVCNGYLWPDQIYINQGDGSFEESIKNYMPKSTMFSMGSDYADINNDGKLDLMVLDMMSSDHYQSKKYGNVGSSGLLNYLKNSFDYSQISKNALYIKNDLNQLIDVSYLAGIHKTDWSWGVLLQDYNNDGLNDIYITNGIKRALGEQNFIKLLVEPENFQNYASYQADLIDKIPTYSVSNRYYINNGGLKFEDQSAQSGLQHFTASNGSAYADLDLDGDLDIVINNLDTVSFVIENKSNEQNKENHYIRFKLEGLGKNTDAIGAKIWVYAGDLVKHTEVSRSRGFESSSERIVHFGLGDNNGIDSVKVIWPGGDMFAIENLKVDTVFRISQKSAKQKHDYTKKNKVKPLLKTTTFNAIAPHQENGFNDFRQDKLLPYMLSKEGPGIASGDLNNDGISDIVTGGAVGFYPVVLISKNDCFERQDLSEFHELITMEVTGILIFDVNNDGWNDIYFASGSNEMNDGVLFRQDLILYNEKGNGFRINTALLPPMDNASTSAVAADFDKDGDIDVFVGGRLMPTNYPEVPNSFIIENIDNKFIDATERVCPELSKIGNVKSALWTDFNNDTWLDLIVVGDFMPISFFKNNKGKLVNITKSLSFANKKGLWNSINAGDFDNDGDIDYIVGNLGLNSYLKATDEEPITIYLGDFDDNGEEEIICYHYLKGINAPLADKSKLIEQMPDLANRFLTSEDYALASINGTVFTQEQLDDAKKFTANFLETSLIENKGDGQFELKPMPLETQYAPVYGSVIEDFNADGYLDILLTGNWFSNHINFGDYDSFRGLTLLGDGKGGFTVLSNKKSGYVNQLDGKSFALHIENNQPVWIIGNNSDEYKAIEFSNFNTYAVYNIPSATTYAEITMCNGKIRKQEFYYGQGYLSQNARIIISNPTIESITFYNQQGNQLLIL